MKSVYEDDRRIELIHQNFMPRRLGIPLALDVTLTRAVFARPAQTG